MYKKEKALIKKFQPKIFSAITGLLLVCVMCSFFSMPLHAEENANGTWIMTADNKRAFVTGTSSIIDMGMQPASRVKVDAMSYGNPNNSYRTLKVPTQVTRQGNYYFIVDCYHNQVLYSKSMGLGLGEWKVMTKDVTLPHSIASDGNLYLVTDTEANRVLVFEMKNGRFQNTQVLENIGIRPHYIQYDSATDSFFAWSSMTGDMYILNKAPDTGIVCIREIRHVNELGNYYVRSFTMVGNQIIFPSGTNRYMVVVDKNTFEVMGRYPVTPEIAGMAYVLPIQNYYYMTVACDAVADQGAATFIRTTDLNSLASGQYEVIYNYVGNAGIPYYIDYFNDAFYMTNAGTTKNIWRFQVQDNQMKGLTAMY